MEFIVERAHGLDFIYPTFRYFLLNKVKYNCDSTFKIKIKII
jgi:hypothetical protein